MAIKGRNLRVYMYYTDRSQFKSQEVAGERSCKLIIKCDNKEVASVTSGIWKEFKAGRLSWQVTAAALLTKDPTRFRTAMLARTPVLIRFAVPEEDNETLAYTGNAIITDFDTSGEVKGYATYSVTFRGTGPLTYS